LNELTISYYRTRCTVQKLSVTYGVKGMMKNLEKREVRSHNKVRALFAENKMRFARAEQL